MACAKRGPGRPRIYECGSTPVRVPNDVYDDCARVATSTDRSVAAVISDRARQKSGFVITLPPDDGFYAVMSPTAIYHLKEANDTLDGLEALIRDFVRPHGINDLLALASKELSDAYECVKYKVAGIASWGDIPASVRYVVKALPRNFDFQLAATRKRLKRLQAEVLSREFPS